MNKFFIDTSFLVGYANNKDKFHKLAKERMELLKNEQVLEFFTSEHVIDEFLNILLKHSGISMVLYWGDILFNTGFTTIIYSDEVIISSAWKLLITEKDEKKPLNFTDCIIYVTSKLLKCDEILTFDDRLKHYLNK